MFAKIYAIGSCAIGVVQIVEAMLALVVSRKMEAWNYIFAGLEVLWIPVAAIAVCFLTTNKKHLISPLSFVAYEVIGFTVSLTLHIVDPQPKNEELPLPFIIAGLLFGIYYLIANIKLYKELKNPTS